MINKIYVSVKDFIKENYLWLLFYIVFIAGMVYPLPYYIYTGGGIMNVDDKIEIIDESNSKGSFNMCYVKEINATIPTYFLSYVIPSWDLVTKEEVTLSENETRKDLLTRDKIYLEQGNQNALLTALKHTNYEYNIEDNHVYVIYIDEKSNTNLKIGDEIVNIDDTEINSLEDISDVLINKNIGDKISIKVKNNDKEYDKYAYVRYENNRKIIGISLETLYDIETSVDVDFRFSKSESGPSGGLILSLALYDKLVDEDITKGYKIAGTGTIDKDGNVGEIGGVKYKLKGAVDSKADIFLVPNGENYEECIKLKEKHNYDIKIIGVDTFEEALVALNKI